MTVKNKTMPVSDDVCEDCPQNWLGSCRAFQVPHSEEERKHRESDIARCTPKYPQGGKASTNAK